MKKLKFKNTGKYLDELSSRYEATINEYIKVRIYKSEYYNGFIFSFLTSNDYSLNSINLDFLSSFWNKATKKQAIIRVEEIINDNKYLEHITEYSKHFNKNLII